MPLVLTTDYGEIVDAAQVASDFIRKLFNCNRPGGFKNIEGIKLRTLICIYPTDEQDPFSRMIKNLRPKGPILNPTLSADWKDSGQIKKTDISGSVFVGSLGAGFELSNKKSGCSFNLYNKSYREEIAKGELDSTDNNPLFNTKIEESYIIKRITNIFIYIPNWFNNINIVNEKYKSELTTIEWRYIERAAELSHHGIVIALVPNWMLHGSRGSNDRRVLIDRGWIRYIMRPPKEIGNIDDGYSIISLSNERKIDFYISDISEIDYSIKKNINKSIKYNLFNNQYVRYNDILITGYQPNTLRFTYQHSTSSKHRWIRLFTLQTDFNGKGTNFLNDYSLLSSDYEKKIKDNVRCVRFSDLLKARIGDKDNSLNRIFVKNKEKYINTIISRNMTLFCVSMNSIPYFHITSSLINNGSIIGINELYNNIYNSNNDEKRSKSECFWLNYEEYKYIKEQKNIYDLSETNLIIISRNGNSYKHNVSIISHVDKLRNMKIVNSLYRTSSYSSNKKKFLVSVNDGIIAIPINDCYNDYKEQINPYYLLALLSSSKGQKILSEVSSKSQSHSISLRNLLKEQIELLPFWMQCEIAERYWKANNSLCQDDLSCSGMLEGIDKDRFENALLEYRKNLKRERLRAAKKAVRERNRRETKRGEFKEDVAFDAPIEEPDFLD